MSNGEKINDKWTEIELLPEWEEEFYNVYTAKKHGKWLMLKTLKPQYRDLPEYQAMIEKEFDVRYNLIHPNIVIITDYEDVPSVGRCIITDDVYGDSLRKLIDQKRVTPQIIEQLRRQLVGALDYIQRNHIVHHPIRPETIIFTEIGGKLKLIDVGFDQRSHLTPADASEDIYNYGKVLIEAIDSCEDKYPQLRRIAERCTNPEPRRRYRDVQELHLALEQKSGNRLYLLIILFLSFMILLLAWLNSPYRPTPPERHDAAIEAPATTDSITP
ncbi:MAG: protein kinase [Muribaculaceae bacterium]|nr:protein kinase [Muribaculaceae bacterium]